MMGIGCDGGGQYVELLRLITNSENLESDIASFEFIHDYIN